MPIITEDDPRLKFVPLEDALTPPAGFLEHMKDQWWCVHPSKGLVFWNARGTSAPQCNKDRFIVDRFREEMYPWSEVRFVPSAFRKIRISDYT